MSYNTLARYFAQGWRVLVPTTGPRFKNGNPEVICRVTVLKRGTEEMVVYTDAAGDLICTEPRALSKH